MEGLRQQLIESEVIGGVVNDFFPRLKLYVFFGEKRISLGDHLLPSDVQQKPRAFQIEYENHETEDAWIKSGFVLVMTEHRRHREYLHWLLTDIILQEPATGGGAGEIQDLVFGEKALATYIPPRSMLPHKIVFTLFKKNESRQSITQSFSRDIFSTRAFTSGNGLGQPLGAAFCYVCNVITRTLTVSHFTDI